MAIRGNDAQFVMIDLSYRETIKPWAWQQTLSIDHSIPASCWDKVGSASGWKVGGLESPFHRKNESWHH